MHLQRSVSLLAFGLLLSLLPAGAIGSEVEPSQIDEIFADYDRTDTPGCALGVIRDGALVYKRGYGMANLEHGLALTPRSVFRIGSTSKQFTAMAVLLLAREGKIDLDADIREILPELAGYDWPVTTRHLIHHTSGYRDYLTLMALSGMRDDDFVTDEQVLDLLARQKELNFEPGTEHLYSNSGYFLLSQIVKRASGKTLHQYAEERIFGPLGMASTHFHDDHTHIVESRAAGYAPKDEGGYRISMTTLDMVGDGGVFTSVEDLLRWDRRFYPSDAGDASLMEEYLTPGVLESGERLTYAFGIGVRRHRGLRKQEHGGAFVGYRADMIRFPDERLSVICLCNRADANPSARAQKVADLYLADRYAPQEVAGDGASGAEAEAPEPVAEATASPDDSPAGQTHLSVETLRKYAGAYKRREEPVVVKIEMEEGALVYVSPYSRYKMTALGGAEFRLEGVPFAVEVRFEKGDGGRRPLLHVQTQREEEPTIYDPVELVRLSEKEIAEYEGEYGCEELNTTMILTAGGAGLALRHEDPFKNAPEEPFEPTLKDTFAAGPVTLEFERGKRNRIAGFRLHAGRVRNLLCVRR